MYLNSLNKHIALDIGQVLVHVDNNIFYRELVLQKCCSNMEEADMFLTAVQPSLDNGIYDMQSALYTYFPTLLDYQIDALIEAWLAVVSVCKPTLDILTQVIAEGANVSLLSNIGKDHAEYLSDICGEQFNYCVKHFSYLVGARKPTKLYFQSFLLEQFNVPYYKGNILFLDDKLENIEAAKAHGFNAKIFDIAQYNTAEEAAADMVKLIKEF